MKTSGKYKFAKQKTFLATCCLLLATVAAVLPLATQAQPSTTDNYRLDPNVSNSFGGLTDSDSYQLLDSGGEAAVGLGDSPSYKLSQGYVSQLEQAIELNVLPDGLVGYWPMNTGAGIQAYDTTANNNRGELINGPSWVDGKVGSGALGFDGTDDHVAVGDKIFDGLSEVSISAWINPNSLASNSGPSGHNQSEDYVIHKAGAGDDSIGLTVASGGTAFYIDTGSDNSLVGSAPATGEWTHVVAVYDGSDMKLYKNGELDAGPQGASGDLISNTNSVQIGGRTDQSEHFDGAIDEVKIYDRSLSEDEVADEYLASEAGIPNALTLPKLDATSSRTVAADAVVRTDAGGYHLAIEQDGDLRTEEGETIPSINGSISAPNLWNEGDTTGFGFTVTDAVQRDGKWGADPDFEYAAVPGSSTTFHTRDGLSGGTKELTSLQFRTGVDATQAGGIYRNRLGFTATLKP